MPGWVYVITNQAMPGLVKVGFTERQPDDRVNDFNWRYYGTAIPFRFVAAYAARVTDPRWLERETHEALGKYRVTKQTRNRTDKTEWFRCSVGEAAATIRRTQWRVGSMQDEIGPFDTGTEIKPPPPEPPTVPYHETLKRIRLANEHWLNQKALALLRENHIPVFNDGSHILTLLWEFSQYSSSGRWREVREFRDGWSLDDILRFLENCSPEAIIRFLIGEIGEDDDYAYICEEDIAQVNSIKEMFDLLQASVENSLSGLDDEWWIPDDIKRWD